MRLPKRSISAPYEGGMTTRHGKLRNLQYLHYKIKFKKKFDRDVAKKETSSEPIDMTNMETSPEPNATVLEVVNDMEEEIIVQLAAAATYAEEGKVQYK